MCSGCQAQPETSTFPATCLYGYAVKYQSESSSSPQGFAKSKKPRCLSLPALPCYLAILNKRFVRLPSERFGCRETVDSRSLWTNCTVRDGGIRTQLSSASLESYQTRPLACHYLREYERLVILRTRKASRKRNRIQTVVPSRDPPQKTVLICKFARHVNLS